MKLREGGPDLVRLAMAVMGLNQVSDVLAAGLEVLAGTERVSGWAALYRIGPGRYAAAPGAGVGHSDLLRLLDKSCGPRARLSLDRVMVANEALGPFDWCVPRSAGGGWHSEPTLVLGYWPRLGNDASSRELHSRISMAGQLIAAAADSARVIQSLVDRSSRDPLTELLNRSGILEAMDRETARSRRGRTPLSVLFLDLDRFKQINDQHGHAVGDEVLEGVAKLISAGLRGSDSLGRMGGDEFLIILPDTDLNGAQAIGRRLAQTVRSTPIETSHGLLTIGLSCGAAGIEEEPSGRRMIEKADRRMLARKRRRSDRERQPVAAAHGSETGLRRVEGA